MRYSKAVVALCIAITLAYTVAVLFLCLVNGELPPDSLTVAFFAMYSVELGACAVIKVNESKESEDDQEADEP